MGCAQRPAPPAVLCSLARSPLPLPLQPLSGYYHHAFGVPHGAFSVQFCQIRTFPTFLRFVNIPKSVQRDARGEMQTRDGETRSEPEPHAIERFFRIDFYISKGRAHIHFFHNSHDNAVQLIQERTMHMHALYI